MKEVICFCKNISRNEIEDAVLSGAKTLKDIKEATGAFTGNQCKELNPKRRCCSPEILEILNSQDSGLQEQCLCCTD